MSEQDHTDQDVKVEAKMPTPDRGANGGGPNFDVQVIVSGTTTTVTVNPNQPVTALIREALRNTGTVGQSADDFELRLPDGTIVDGDAKIGEAGIAAGVVLTLQPRVGVGG